MSDAPETIWAWPHWDERNWYAGGCSTEVNLGMLGKQADEQTQYTRTDTVLEGTMLLGELINMTEGAPYNTSVVRKALDFYLKHKDNDI